MTRRRRGPGSNRPHNLKLVAGGANDSSRLDGGSGSGSGGSWFRPGQNVDCRIVESEPGGYSVMISAAGLPGFLPTQAMLQPGQEIVAQYVCVHNGRLLLSARFSSTHS